MQSYNTNHIFKRSILACAVVTLLSPISFAQEEQVNSNETIEELENFSPETSAIDLSKVVVTAGGFSQEVKSAPASISVISKAELDNAPFRDVTDALKDVPGVVITGGGASQDISIRGMAPQYTLMMVDGKRQSSRETRPNSDGAGIEQGWVPPLAAIERIEVVRGPISSRYGSDAMGGVVNIITKKVADKWGGNIRTDFTLTESSDRGNTNTTEFYLAGPLIAETLGLQLYGKHSGREEDKVNKGFPEQRLQNFGGKLSFVPVKGQTFELEAGMGFQKRFSHVGKTIAEFNDKGKRNKDSENKYKRNNISLRYLGEFDGGITSDLLISHEENNNYSRDMKVKNFEVSGNVIVPVETHTITLGGQYRTEKLSDAGNQINPDLNKVERWAYSFFIEDEWWLLDNFALTGGLRYDYDENYGGEFTPRLYAVWNIDDVWTLKGGMSKGYSAPGLRQSTDGWGQISGGGMYAIDGVILGNSKLKPEKTTNYEISTSFTPNETLDINATAFYTKFKDKIETTRVCNMIGYGGTDATCLYNGTEFWYIDERTNVDNAKLYGFELAARWQPIDTLTLSSSYTYTKTKITSGDKKGTPLNRVPDHLFNIKTDWQFAPQANAWAKVSYHGKEKASTSRGGPLDKQYNGYTIVDLGMSYKYNNDTNIYGGIYNLTDKRIDDDNYGKRLDGRRYWVGISIDF